MRTEKLKKLIADDYDDSQASFAKAIGKSPSQVNQWLAGRRAMGEKVIRDIENAAHLPRGWFDDESALSAREPSAPYKIQKSSNLPPKPNKSDTILINQYDTGGAMGHGLLLQGFAGVIHSMQVSREWVQLNLRQATKPENLCIVTGFGDSMRGMYNPGDPLIVDTGVKTVDFDGVYFFRVANEGFIKRLQRVPGEGLLAISENKAYREWSIKPEMDFEIFGRVLKAWKSEDF